MNRPYQSPALQFADTGAHVGAGNAQSPCDFLSGKRRRGNVQQRVDLRHRPVDSPARSHLSPVQNELFLGCAQVRHISLMTEITELSVRCQDNYLPVLYFLLGPIDRPPRLRAAGRGPGGTSAMSPAAPAWPPPLRFSPERPCALPFR